MLPGARGEHGHLRRHRPRWTVVAQSAIFEQVGLFDGGAIPSPASTLYAAIGDVVVYRRSPVVLALIGVGRRGDRLRGPEP